MAVTQTTTDINPQGHAMYDASRKRRTQKRRGRDEGDEVSDLNITPMLDMMTILLVFLIKSFGASASNVTVSNLVLPHSSTKLRIEEGLQLMITSKELLVDQKPIMQLGDRSTISEDDLPEGPGTYLVGPLYDVLEQRADYFKQIDKYGGTEFVGRIAIIADKNIAYQTLFKVLYTAGRAEFGLFKLFVQADTN